MLTKYFLVLFLFVPNLMFTQVMEASEIKISIKPLDHKLISSSITSQHKFYDPFLIENVNTVDKFSYDYKNKMLFFNISKLPIINEKEKSLYLGVQGASIAFVNYENGYSKLKRINKHVLISPPSNSILGALSSAAGANTNPDVLIKMYNLGKVKNANNLQIGIKLNNIQNKENIILTLILKKDDFNVIDEITNYIYAPLTILTRLLGESNNTTVAFSNYKIRFSGNLKYSFKGEFTENKALKIVCQDYIWKTGYSKYDKKSVKYIKWNSSKFINLSNYKYFVSKEGAVHSFVSVLKVDNNQKMLTIKTERTDGGGRAYNQYKYSLFLFKKFNNEWYLSNYMNDEKSYGEFSIIDLGATFGLISTYEGWGQGYSSEYTSIYIPSNGMKLKKVLNKILTSEDNGGAVTNEAEKYSYQTKLITQHSESDFNNIIFHKKGTFLNTTYEIDRIDKKVKYAYNGEAYTLVNL